MLTNVRWNIWCKEIRCLFHTCDFPKNVAFTRCFTISLFSHLSLGKPKDQSFLHRCQNPTDLLGDLKDGPLPVVNGVKTPVSRVPLVLYGIVESEPREPNKHPFCMFYLQALPKSRPSKNWKPWSWVAAEFPAGIGFLHWKVLNSMIDMIAQMSKG